MTIKKDLQHWERVFLDTSVIIDYLAGGHPTDKEVDDRRKFTVKLIDQLVAIKTHVNKSRVFVISSITITELKKLQKPDGIIDTEIVNALKTENVEFTPFDNEAAEYMNKSFYSTLNKEQQKEFADSTGMVNNGNYTLARKWILIDLMIISSAASPSNNVDIILSSDKNTFGEICKRLNLNYAITDPANFNISPNGNNIFALN